MNNYTGHMEQAGSRKLEARSLFLFLKGFIASCKPEALSGPAGRVNRRQETENISRKGVLLTNANIGFAGGTAKILSTNASRFSKRLKVSPTFVTQPLGVSKTLKVSDNIKREQKIKSDTILSIKQEFSPLPVLRRENRGDVRRTGGSVVANNVKLSAYET